MSWYSVALIKSTTCPDRSKKVEIIITYEVQFRCQNEYRSVAMSKIKASDNTEFENCP